MSINTLVQRDTFIHKVDKDMKYEHFASFCIKTAQGILMKWLDFRFIWSTFKEMMGPNVVKQKLESSAPFKTETLFADEVQPVFHKLESHKQANKPVNAHVSVQKTPNLTEDQTTNPEAPISPKNARSDTFS